MVVLRQLLNGIHYPLVRALFRPRWEGRDHVPLSGPAVLCANHAAYIDPPILNFPVYFRRGGRLVHYMALSEYFQGPTGWYLRLYDAIPVPESGVSSQAFRLALETLGRGGLLGVFPEGGRSPDGRLQPFHPGAARIAVQAGAPIVPATINGSYDAWPAHRKMLRPHPVEVIYHPPIPTDTSRRRDAAYVQDLTDRVREAVASRLRPPCRPPREEA